MVENWVVICSPVSGKKKGREEVEQVLLPSWKGYGLNSGKLAVVYTEHARHAVDLAREYGNAKTGLIVVGGDGTINEVIEGLESGGKLKETPVALLSQGTMNFFAVTAGLPDARTLPSFISSGSVRQFSLMKVLDNSGKVDRTSFEAFHIGQMAYRVCKAIPDWRFRPGGPMFGIFKELIQCNLFPGYFCQKGELKLTLANNKMWIVKDNFYWIVCSHRNPYTGVVGDKMWVSFMTLTGFPGFGRMMEFFAPPMEHYAGLSYCFEAWYECTSLEFTVESRDGIGMVIDGDAYLGHRYVTVRNEEKAWTVVANQTAPVQVDAKFISVDYITPAAQRFRKNNPPTVRSHPVKRATPTPDDQSVSGPIKAFAAVALIYGAYYLFSKRRKAVLDR